MIQSKKSAPLKILFISIFCLCAAALPAEGFAQDADNDQLNPEEYFDFWIGEWEVSWDEGDGQVGRGANVVEKILDGTVIQENFTITEGNQSGFKGTSISVYQTRNGLWKQAWADNNGGYYDFTGEVDDGKRIFKTGINDLEDGRRMVQRMVFYDITEDSLIWDWEASYDGGQTWTLNWRIRYSRIGPG